MSTIESASQQSLTDKQKLTNLLTEFGVGFKEKDSGNEIECYSGSAKVSGYSDFYTIFTFDETGKFIEMAAWE